MWSREREGQREEEVARIIDVTACGRQFQSDTEFVEFMRGIERNWKTWTASKAGQAQHKRIWETTRTLVHGDLHFGNMMWSKKLQKLKIFDFEMLGVEPAAAELLYLVEKFAAFEGDAAKRVKGLAVVESASLTCCRKTADAD